MPGQRLYRSNTNASLTLSRVRLQSRDRLIDGSGTSAPASDRRLFRSLKSKNDMRLARWSAAMRYDAIACSSLLVTTSPRGHLSRIARGVGTHPNRSRQDSRGHPCPNGAEVLCPRAWNVPRIDAFRRLREPEGYEQSLRVPAACPGMPQSCQHGEVFSTPGVASQDGYRLGNTRQRLRQDGGRAGANCPARKHGTEEP